MRKFYLFLYGFIFTVLIVAAFLIGCGSGGSGSGGSSSSGSLSQSQANAFASRISSVAVTGTNRATETASEAYKSIQNNLTTTLVNVPLDYTLTCTAGGRMHLLGSITGSVDSNGTGVLLLGATITITDWKCDGSYTYNGDPYISITGTFSFLNGYPSTQQHVVISGGFKWGTTAAQSCQIYLNTNFNSSGGGRTTGYVGSYNVDISF